MPKLAIDPDKVPATHYEAPDPTPMQLPVGFKRPESLEDTMRRLVRSTLSAAADAAGSETFEESEDFDVDDEVDPRTPYEEFFDPGLGVNLTADEIRRNEAVYAARTAERYPPSATPSDPSPSPAAKLPGTPPGEGGGTEVKGGSERGAPA